jgi:molecular chaperone GrpE
MTSKRKRRMAEDRYHDPTSGGRRTEAGEEKRADRPDTLGEAGIGSDEDVTSIDVEMEGLRSELADLNSKWMRALADLDNYKKRVERDRCRWADAAKEEVILDVLEVVDNFERALACDGGAAPESGSFREGVELILKQLTDLLRRHGVVAIDTKGCEFDPNIHEAVGQIESEKAGPNEIVEETQKGYMLGDKPLRCSKVIVAR